MESVKNRWGGDRREKGRETDDEQCWGDRIQEESWREPSCAGLGWMAGQPVFVV